MREKKKKVKRENVEFQQRGYRNSSAQFCCPGVRGVRGVPKVKNKKKKFDKLIVAMSLPKQGKKIITIVAMALPKMGGKKVVPKSRESKKKKSYVHNIFTINHM